MATRYTTPGKVWLDRDGETGLAVERPIHFVEYSKGILEFFTEGAAEFFVRMTNRDCFTEVGQWRNFSFPGDK